MKITGILSRALAVAVMLTLSLLSYSQQDVDPTWYNPWLEPIKAVAHKPQPGPTAKSEKKKNITAANTRKKNSAPRDARVQRPKQVATTKSPSPQ